MQYKSIDRSRTLRTVAVGALLTGVAMPANLSAATDVAAASTASNASSGTQAPTDESQQEIIVNAPLLFPDILPERSLDQDAIDSYGANSVDEILNDIEVELGDDTEQPLLIVNGQRVSSLEDIGALPVEVLRGIEVLPRGSALRAGGTATQRVISIRLKPHLRTVTVAAAHKVATEGNWNADRGEASLTSIKGETRANITFRVRDESSLLESQRGIIQSAPSFPFALAGNIIGFPNTRGEIDPLLSALAGQPVTVVPMPSSAPTLQQLAALANQQNVTDLGQFRTLRPQTRNYDLNGSFATRLSAWLTANFTFRWNHNDSHSLRGLPSALFILSPTNPFSPFSTQAALALYGQDPLRSVSTLRGGQANATFNATWGSWNGNLNLRRGESTNIYTSQLQATFGTIPVDNSINPFTTDLTKQILLRDERTSTRNINTLADLTFTGPALKLPAGEVQAIIEGRLGWNRLEASSTFSTLGNGTFRRDEQSIRGGLDIPITSRDSNFGGAIGDVAASVEYSRSHYSDAGSVNHHTYGLTWAPVPPLRLHASIDTTSAPAPIQTLGEPVIIVPNVRVFDPLTGQTVDVTEITGGNPTLTPQSTKVRDVTALLKLVPKLNLQLNAEYIDTDVRDFVSSLPEASAPVELAFPDRYVRDSNGVLTTVDLRPVNFDSHRDKRLRWGLSMNTKIGGGVSPGTPGAPRQRIRPPTYFQLTVNHTIVFSDAIVIRPGLPSVDLLGGGAIGIASARPRHEIDGTAALTNGGLGIRLGVTWRGSNELLSRINGVTDTLQFSPLLAVNLRAFADLKRFLPHDKWARGLRLSLDVINAMDKRQQVRDSFGNTPLQFQPALRDPLGRTIEVELRKVF